MRCTATSILLYDSEQSTEVVLSSVQGIQELARTASASDLVSSEFAWCLGTSSLGWLVRSGSNIIAKVASSTAQMSNYISVIDAIACPGNQIGMTLRRSGSSSNLPVILSYSSNSAKFAYMTDDGDPELDSGYRAVQCFPRSSGQGVAFFNDEKIYIATVGSTSNTFSRPSSSWRRSFPDDVEYTGASVVVTQSSGTYSLYRFWNGKSGSDGVSTSFIASFASPPGDPYAQTATLHPFIELSEQSAVFLWDSNDDTLIGYFIEYSAPVASLVALSLSTTKLPQFPGPTQWLCDVAVMEAHTAANTMIEGASLVGADGDLTLCTVVRFGNFPSYQRLAYCLAGPVVSVTQAPLQPFGVLPNHKGSEMLVSVSMPSFFRQGLPVVCPVTGQPPGGRSGLTVGNKGVLPEWFSCRLGSIGGSYLCAYDATNVAEGVYTGQVTLAPSMRQTGANAWAIIPRAVPDMTLELVVSWGAPIVRHGLSFPYRSRLSRLLLRSFPSRMSR